MSSELIGILKTAAKEIYVIYKRFRLNEEHAKEMKDLTLQIEQTLDKWHKVDFKAALRDDGARYKDFEAKMLEHHAELEGVLSALVDHIDWVASHSLFRAMYSSSTHKAMLEENKKKLEKVAKEIKDADELIQAATLVELSKLVGMDHIDDGYYTLQFSKGGYEDGYGREGLKLTDFFVSGWDGEKALTDALSAAEDGLAVEVCIDPTKEKYQWYFTQTMEKTFRMQLYDPSECRMPLEKRKSPGYLDVRKGKVVVRRLEYNADLSSIALWRFNVVSKKLKLYNVEYLKLKLKSGITSKAGIRSTGLFLKVNGPHSNMTFRESHTLAVFDYASPDKLILHPSPDKFGVSEVSSEVTVCDGIFRVAGDFGEGRHWIPNDDLGKMSKVRGSSTKYSCVVNDVKCKVTKSRFEWKVTYHGTWNFSYPTNINENYVKELPGDMQSVNVEFVFDKQTGQGVANVLPNWVDHPVFAIPC